MKAGLFIALILAATGCLAQGSMELAPSRAATCLQPPAAERGAPTYPVEARMAGFAGKVHVELEFAAPDRAPQVRITEAAGPEEMQESVKDFVARYRVPCLAPADYPVRLLQEFVFTPGPGSGLSWTNTREEADVRLSRCVEHVSGRRRPEFPREAIRQGRAGLVLAQIHFLSPSGVPQVEVIHRKSAKALGAAVAEYARGYRMPCLPPGRPLVVVQEFVFRLDDFEERSPPEQSLVSFLGSVRDLRSASVSFDLTQMACPFDVKLHYRQPHLPSLVRTDSLPIEVRRPLLDWLSTLRLDVPPDSEDLLFGVMFTIKVPCGRLDL